MIGDAISDLVPSRTADDFDVPRGFGFEESMSVRVLHGAAVIHHPYSQGVGADGLCERGRQSTGVALFHELFDLFLRDDDFVAHSSGRWEVVVAFALGGDEAGPSGDRCGERGVVVLEGDGDWDWNCSWVVVHGRVI